MGPGIRLGGLIVSGVSYASLIFLFRANKESQVSAQCRIEKFLTYFSDRS